MPRNRRLRGFRDVAQHSSVEVRILGHAVELAFSRSEGEATVLIDILRVPNDPYRLERARNVVVLWPKGASGSRDAVISCLKP